ncbi:WD40 repeat-like protein [Serendipita vermifera]|nr:WD40 repeat-like protein [Serendipita vermifera]
MDHRNDLAGSPGRTGAASPSLGGRGGPPHPAALKRKLTLLQLIDELSALKDDEQNLHTYGSYDEKRDKDHFVEHEDYEDPSFKEGAEAFRRFDKVLSALDQGLAAFQTAARQLGSSVGLLASAAQLRNRLMKVEALFHENASEIFPSIKSKFVDTSEQLKPRTKKKPPARTRSNSKALLFRPAAMNAAPDPETLPYELFELAKDVKAFLKHLEEFPEFVDEALNASITAFESDLRYRADCLSEYEDQFRWPAVQRYVHAVSTEMTVHMQTMTQALKDFVDNGVPAIRFAQKHNGNNLLNLSTIATFFSGVTATAAQYSFDQTESTLDNMVNLLFFGSLVLSISAAINSLLGLTWKHAMYRSPRHRVPWWVLIWIKRSPIVFMVVSVALFSTGLVCFCYSSQTIYVSITVLVLTCFCTFGLLAVSAWFTAERWIYSKHNGLRWLSDVIHEHWNRFIKYPPIQFIRYIPRRIISALRKFGRCLFCRPDTDSDSEDGLPFPNGVDGRSSATPSPVEHRHNRSVSAFEKGDFLDSPIVTTNPIRASEDDVSHMAQVPHSPVSPRSPFSPARMFSLASVGASSTINSHNSPSEQNASTTNMAEGATAAGAPSAAEGGAKLKGASRFRQLAWKVVEKERAQTPSRGNTAMSQTRATTILSDAAKRRDTNEGKGTESQIKPGRLTALRPNLKRLQVTHTIPDHTALVRHLQFSPNGKLLATCGWDGTARLFDVPHDANDVVGRHRTMAVYGGFLGQVAWSPDGNWLLTKWTTGIQIWSEAGVRKKNIPRYRPVRSVAWFPTRHAFLSVEDSQVVEVNLDGNIVETHQLDRLEIHDVAITPDEERMLCVGVLKTTKGGLQPSMSRVEKRLVGMPKAVLFILVLTRGLVYNLKQTCIENSVPVLDDVRDITISRNGSYALVSSENKGHPQLFRLDEFKQQGVPMIRLVPFRTYVPKSEVDFAGPSYFAGQQDEFILVPTKAGDILFWDRDSGRLLHALRNKDVGDGDLTSIAWNYASKKHMLASASHDGTVRIWMSTPSERESTRIEKEKEQEVTYASPFNIDVEGGLSASPLGGSRKPTATTEGGFILSDSTANLNGRSSLDGSADSHGGGGGDGGTARGRSRRVDSPVPAEFYLDKGKDPGPRPASRTERRV